MERKDDRGVTTKMTEFFQPYANRVFVLAPHPDDESLGCAGTIALYASSGVDVYLIIVSKGDKLETKIDNVEEIRKSETIKASKILGIKETIFLDFPDEEIDRHKDEVKEKIKELIRHYKADLIFAPFPLDPHPDHNAVSDVALSLLRDIRGIKIAFYEICNPIRFNMLIDISSVINKKKEAILSYEKSLLGIPDIFWHSIKGLNNYRSFLVKRKGFYETFWLVDSPLSDEDIVDWVTYGRSNSAAKIFISKLRQTDELIYEIQKAYGLLRSKEQEILNLKAIEEKRFAELKETLYIKETEIEKLQGLLKKANEELQQVKEDNKMLSINLELIKNSFFWRFINKFYKIRDSLLREGTKRRDIYNRIVKGIKNKI